MVYLKAGIILVALAVAGTLTIVASRYDQPHSAVLMIVGTIAITFAAVMLLRRIR
jgi:hypothetical protein